MAAKDDEVKNATEVVKLKQLLKTMFNNASEIEGLVIAIAASQDATNSDVQNTVSSIASLIENLKISSEILKAKIQPDSEVMAPGGSQSSSKPKR